jgi:hypothetical protein
MSAALDRRGFLGLLGSALLTAACGPEQTQADARRLAAQREAERAASGRGPFGALRYRGYRGLAALPWFELGPEGQLRLVDDGVPAAIDFHVHLGISALFAPDLDLHRATPRVQHLLDCDGSAEGCELDLDVYLNTNFGAKGERALELELLSQGLWGSDAAETHTIPNLLREMDAMRVERSVVLPIALGLPFRDRLMETWREAIEAAGAGDRLLAGASVHPRDPGWRASLAAAVESGARVVKFHPAVQRCAPNDPAALEIFAECERRGAAVFFHCGRAGLEPASGLYYNLVRHYAEPVRRFPGVRFVLGHAGARDSEEAAELAARHANVWLDAQGQGATRLSELLSAVGPEKLVFGTDWPWYHVGATLAKVLLVTQHDAGARRRILRDNAREILGLT